ncbi:NarL family transcriptional regulator [Candidatus Kaiserbacteria bacterium RIFCSPHIGHO2_02_FULL_49_34]|uniref:NarL family transcriptional regulator n=1 Tax=Candidatus Kaiserbacteria bacterium RIFCSPHIGHO2_02_FULL_49_34 TaxID=1798491 RepID=A0A1F6DIH2_9BACT|nr:MAG: NarL family transcriptional regulator [Candidatus Kaiserbacteria bacterium RIFCSPHIGHO2_02_FULL_49_34]
MRVPYAQSVHGEEEVQAVVNVLRGNTALGPKTKEFEEKTAAHFGKKYGIMVNSGSSANLLALELLNAEPGDEIITPLLTFGTVVAPILQKGLVPVFLDVDEGTYVIDADKVEAAITPKTKALLIPSLLGNLPNLEKLAAIAAKHNIVFIEDSCDTFGGSFKGQPTGTYSHITTTSFYGSHIINGAGGGGMVMVNSEALAERLVVLRGWGRRSSLFGEGAESEKAENRFNVELGGVQYDAKFVFSEIGYNFLPLELSAAFALEQLKRLDGFAATRRSHYASLLQFFKQYEKYFILPKQTEGADAVWLAFPVVIRDSAPFVRKDIALFLEAADIQTRPVFTGNVLKQPAFEKIPHRLAEASYENTEQVMRGGLVFACHQGLTEEQLDYVKEQITTFIATRTTTA